MLSEEYDEYLQKQEIEGIKIKKEKGYSEDVKVVSCWFCCHKFARADNGKLVCSVLHNLIEVEVSPFGSCPEFRDQRLGS